jgi:hypothetical protein
MTLTKESKALFWIDAIRLKVEGDVKGGLEGSLS